MDTEELTSRNIHRSYPHVNEELERFDGLNQPWVAALLGGGLILGAVMRRSVPLALAGGVLLYRGATGRWAFCSLFGRSAGAKQHPGTSVPHETGIKVERSIAIYKTPKEIYNFWRNLENLPRFMSHVVEVKQVDDNRSHWKVRSVAGTTFEWNAEIINEIPNELIAWRSLEAADVDHAGSVHFEADPRGGTVVRVVLEYRPPAGMLGAGIARLLGQEPTQLIEQDLHRLKQIMEIGESPSVEGQPHGAAV